MVIFLLVHSICNVRATAWPLTDVLSCPYGFPWSSGVLSLQDSTLHLFLAVHPLSEGPGIVARASELRKKRPILPEKNFFLIWKHPSFRCWCNKLCGWRTLPHGTTLSLSAASSCLLPQERTVMKSPVPDAPSKSRRAIHRWERVDLAHLN